MAVRIPVRAVSIGAVLLILAAARAGMAESFDCVITPSMTLKIGSPVATTLQSVEVDRGDHVRKGQVLARLDSAVEAADVDLNAAKAANLADIVSHQARAAFAEAEVRRGEALLQGANVARQKVEELRTNLQVAQNDLQIAVLNHQLAELELQRSQALLQERVIRSPIDAIVTQRLLGPGEYVNPDGHILELAAVSPLFVEAYPPVRYFDRIRAGQTGLVRTETQATDLRAVISIVDRVFDPASGTFGVRLTLPNDAGTVPAGQRCRVELDTGAAPLPAGPAKAPGG